MTISALPTPPSRAGSPDDFAAKGDALLGALPAFVTEANALQADVNAKQVTASTAATTAITQAGIATTKAGEASVDAADADAARIAAESARDLAAGYRDSAAFSSGQAAASALTASNAAGTCASLVAGVADGPVTSVNGKTGIVTLAPADIAAAASKAEMEAGTEADIRSMSPLRVKQAIDVLAGSKLIRSARTANTMLGVADKGALIDITSGTFTQTFDAVATLGNGWWCYIKNSGTGDITLDPNASETIDGLTSYKMYPGEVRLVQCDGAALRAVVLNSFYKVFTTSGTFTKPPGYSAFEGMLWGAGGGGDASVGVGGGGGGGCSPVLIPVGALGPTASVTIGSGGAVNSSGGSSTFAGLTVPGGQPGSPGGGGAGGGLVSASDKPDGFGGGIGNAASVYGGGGGGAAPDYGAASVYGGGGGAGGSSPTGGTSVYGGSGGGAYVNGVAPAGGGGAAAAGARGELRIWGII